MNNEKQIAIKGGLWTGLSTAVSLLTAVARMMILTRFLEKSDFGIVSIINMIIGLCTTFTDLGFASVIMYKQNLSDKEFSSLYWIQFIFFIFIYVVLCFISPCISQFYHKDILSSLIPLASLSIICQSFGKLYESVLQKKYQFKVLAYRNIVTNIFSLGVAIVLAIYGQGVLSLVISTLVQALLVNVWNLWSGSRIQKLSLYLDFKEIISLVRIGVYQTGTRILDYISSKLDVMLMGRLLGTEALGMYDLSKDLVLRFVDLVRTVVSKVALPIMSNSNSDDKEVINKFFVTTRLVAILCIPLCITICVFSADIVHVVYGQEYIDISPIVSIFAISTIVTSLTSLFDMLGISKGRTDLNFKNTVVRVILTTPIIYFSCHYSIVFVSFSQLLLSLILAFVFWRIVVSNTYSISLRLYMSQFSRILLAFVFIGIIQIGLNTFIISYLCNLWVVKLILAVILYLALITTVSYAFLKKEQQFLLSLLRK